MLRCVVACPTIFSTVRCSSTTGFIIAMPFLSRLLRLLLLLCSFFFLSLFSRIATILWFSPSFSDVPGGFVVEGAAAVDAAVAVDFVAAVDVIAAADGVAVAVEVVVVEVSFGLGFS